MISHKYKCIFIHIPKCAGSSIETALGHLDGYEGRNSQDHRCIKMIENPLVLKHIVLNQANCKEILHRFLYKYKSHQNSNNKNTITREQYTNYFKFTIVRNPWSRAFSWYQNVIRDDLHKKRLEISETLSFNEFLPQFIGKGPLRTQTYWLKNFSGSISLDFIGRFENLHQDFKKACKLMDIKPIALPHRIKSENFDFRTFYNDELIDLVANVYQEEIKLFNYCFDS